MRATFYDIYGQEIKVENNILEISIEKKLFFADLALLKLINCEKDIKSVYSINISNNNIVIFQGLIKEIIIKKKLYYLFFQNNSFNYEFYENMQIMNPINSEKENKEEKHDATIFFFDYEQNQIKSCDFFERINTIEISKNDIMYFFNIPKKVHYTRVLIADKYNIKAAFEMNLENFIKIEQQNRYIQKHEVDEFKELWQMEVNDINVKPFKIKKSEINIIQEEGDENLIKYNYSLNVKYFLELEYFESFIFDIHNSPQDMPENLKESIEYIKIKNTNDMEILKVKNTTENIIFNRNFKKNWKKISNVLKNFVKYIEYETFSTIILPIKYINICVSKKISVTKDKENFTLLIDKIVIFYRNNLQYVKISGIMKKSINKHKIDLEKYSKIYSDQKINIDCKQVFDTIKESEISIIRNPQTQEIKNIKIFLYHLKDLIVRNKVKKINIFL